MLVEHNGQVRYISMKRGISGNRYKGYDQEYQIFWTGRGYICYISSRWSKNSVRVVEIPPEWGICPNEPHVGEVLDNMLRKKVTQPGVPAQAAIGLSGGYLAASCPTVWEHLTQSAYPDGTARETSTLSVSVSDGSLKACLRDRDNGLCCWAASQAWDALWAALEAQASDEAAWRVDRYARVEQPAAKGPRKK